MRARNWQVSRLRLGEIVVVHSRSIRNSVTEIWKDGHAFKSLQRGDGTAVEEKGEILTEENIGDERRGLMKEFKKLSDS